jgi:hypothetical protein
MALPAKLPQHPVVLEEQARRAADIQLRIADWITAFGASMNFVCLHVMLFTAWMLFIESKPWPTLTLIVSPPAIFLSTFVMIGQNRQAEVQQADHDFTQQELELKDQHRADLRDPPAHDRAAHAAHRPPHRAGEATVTALGCSPRTHGLRSSLRAGSARSVHGHPATSQEPRPSIGRLSGAVPVNARPDQDVCGVDM